MSVPFIFCSLNNKDRRSPPKKGTIITYKFQEYTNSGTPRFPTYVGMYTIFVLFPHSPHLLSYLLSRLLNNLVAYIANNMDPSQTVP